MRDPRPDGEYDAASARAKDIGQHLAASLASANAYERLFALEYIGTKRGPVSADVAAPLAALVVDRTPVLSLLCQSCRREGRYLDGCSGRMGNADCGCVRELGPSAHGPLMVLASGPLRTAVADALWTIAVRSDADAAAVAPLMPAYGDALRARVRSALDGPGAAAALRLLVSFSPARCGDDGLAGALARRMADGAPDVRARAAVAILVCSDGSASWRELGPSAVATIDAVLADPRREILGEMPAIASVVAPLARAIGLRMANRAAVDARQAGRLFRPIPTAAAGALPGFGARLKVSDVDESVQLLMIIALSGAKAASLKSAILMCVRRTGVAMWAIEALGATRARLSDGERALLRRAYRKECSLESDCPPFAQVMADAYRPSP